MFHTIVVGAGICGLTAAFSLHRRGVEFQVLEASPTPGGLIQTHSANGFLMEAGPHTFPSTASEMTELCAQLGLTPQAAASNANKRYLVLNGKLQALPQHPLDIFSTRVLSFGGKMRLLQEPFQSKTRARDVSVADFLTHRLGKEGVENLADPFISGIYAGDVKTLSMPAAFPKWWQMEQEAGSLLKGALKNKSANKASSSSSSDAPPKSRYQMLSFENGMHTLPHALAQALPRGAIQCDTAVITISIRENNGARIYELLLSSGEKIDCRHLILAVPAPVAAGLLQALAPQATEALRQIPYNGLNVVHHGFRQADLQHALDGFGFLIPRKENLPLLGTIWASALFPGRAPQGQALLTSFIGGAHHPEISTWEPDKISQTVLENLRRIFGNTHLTPIHQNVLRYDHAIPQYTLGHLERISAIDSALKTQLPGITLTGNYLHGIALNECVQSAQKAAQSIASLRSD